MSDLARRVEALRRPLAEAARDSFAGLAGVRDLGGVLRRACDQVVEAAPEEFATAFGDWRRRLDGFDVLEQDLQAVEVARGLRLCQTAAGAAPRRPPPVARDGSPLEAPLTTLPGIGPRLYDRLAERGLATVEDLLWLIPRRYDDVRHLAPLKEALAAGRSGQRVSISAVAESSRFFRRGRRRWVDLRLRDAEEPRARLTVRWFHAHGSMARRFPKGSEVALSGVLKERAGAYEMANPDLLSITTPDGEATRAGPPIIPRYPDVPGVPPATLRKACAAAVARAGRAAPDAIPPELTPSGLPPLREALAVLHAPPESLSTEEAEELDRGESRWHRRLAFDDLFILGLAVARRRRERRSGWAVRCPPAGDPVAAAERALPFSLTGAQRRAVATISGDLARDVPMNRLLQGDVGSGKTAVVFAAAVQAAAAGRQTALMAPTEILAEQHAGSLEPWCRALGIRMAKLTASTPKGVRASTLSLLAAGEIDLLLGTHALLAEGVVFSALGLVVVDEQHRFGVAQRVRLRDKGEEGEGTPHLLVTTATPIPRTLALTAYGDLDVSVLDELPPGRLPTETRVFAGARGRQSAYRQLRRRLAAGERAFVVCPLVEPGEGEEARDWADAATVAGELARELAPAGVGLVHGRMASADREEAMARFRDGSDLVLVATTVVEVGVDVPEATVMVIEDADRFGLSQLHQLRGRIGRGGGDSLCLLCVRGRREGAARRRLEVMEATSDGFRIAEEDLAIRGPGELLGARQAGIPRMRFGDLRAHAELLLLARDAAERLCTADPELARHPEARALLERRLAEGEAYGSEGG